MILKLTYHWLNKDVKQEYKGEPVSAHFTVILQRQEEGGGLKNTGKRPGETGSRTAASKQLSPEFIQRGDLLKKMHTG